MSFFTVFFNFVTDLISFSQQKKIPYLFEFSVYHHLPSTNTSQCHPSTFKYSSGYNKGDKLLAITYCILYTQTFLLHFVILFKFSIIISFNYNQNTSLFHKFILLRFIRNEFLALIYNYFLMLEIFYKFFLFLLYNNLQALYLCIIYSVLISQQS